VSEEYYPPVAPDNFNAPTRVFEDQTKYEPRMVSVGFPRERKGLDYIEKLANNINSTIFVYGNDGDFVSENKHINLMGAGPINWANYDMILVLSVSEPWGIAAMEAAQHDVYVVGWRTIDALVELEKDNLASTFEFGDVDSASQFVRNWSPKVTDQRRSYERFASKFSANQIYGDIREILRTISSKSDYSQR
jgi:glycosyltransferase involved in cell wall biosynthesis